MTAAPKLKIETVDIDSVRPLDRNARRGNVDFIRGQLRRFGQYVPIVVRAETGEILKGNHTWLAMKEEGATRIAIVRRSEPDDDEAMTLAIGDNAASDLSEWDVPELHSVLVELPDLQNTGFDAPALAALATEAALLSAADPGELDDQAAPEPPAKPKTRDGDLIELGEHRLLCGSSMIPANVERLLDGIEPLLIFTDPPYGVEFDPEWRDRAGFNGKRVDGRVVPGSKPTAAAEPGYRNREATDAATAGDTIVDYSDVVALCPSAVVAYFWHADRHTDAVLAGLERNGFERVQMILWDKVDFVMSRTLYHWRHEPCWLVRKAGARVPFYGERNQQTIWTARSPKRMGANPDEGSFDHPTQKPLAICRPPIENHLLPGEWVFEPFAGSGSTLIAAELLGRRCAAVEVDPGYCDVIVQRWEEQTGQKANRPRRRRSRPKEKAA